MVPMPPTDTVVFSVRMPKELHQRLVELSRADYSTVNRSIVVAVERYIRQMKARQPKDASDAR
jgi:predicted DNA-binding protein